MTYEKYLQNFINVCAKRTFDEYLKHYIVEFNCSNRPGKENNYNFTHIDVVYNNQRLNEMGCIIKSVGSDFVELLLYPHEHNGKIQWQSIPRVEVFHITKLYIKITHKDEKQIPKGKNRTRVF